MKAKHLEIESHRELYQSIHKEISQGLNIDRNNEAWYFYLKALFYCSIATLAYVGIFTIENTLLFTLNFILFGFVAVMLCFNFAHDLSHHALFKSAFWNNFFFEFIYTLVGAHPEAWKNRHTNAHHFAPNVRNYDTDLAITGLIRVLPSSDQKWFHKYQHLYAILAYMSYSFYWVTIKDFVVLSQFAPKKGKTRYYSTFVFLKIAYVTYMLVLPILFSKQPFIIVAVSFLMMHLTQSVYTLFTFFVTHHVEGAQYPESNEKGVINTSWFLNQIDSSNNFHPFSHIANFIFGGVNNHIAHHLFPHINHYYYPQVNKILFRRLEAAGIKPKVTTYFGGIRSHLAHLKHLGKQN